MHFINLKKFLKYANFKTESNEFSNCSTRCNMQQQWFMKISHSAQNKFYNAYTVQNHSY